MTKKAWVVVANGSVARILAGSRPNDLEVLEIIEHPDARLMSRDLVSDKPGRSYDSFGAGRHAVEPPKTPKEVESERFALKLSQHLAKAHAKGAFEALYLIAAPHFLGLLRAALNPQTLKSVAQSMSKDVTFKTPSELEAYLPLHL